jgi:hypothetical protein
MVKDIMEDGLLFLWVSFFTQLRVKGIEHVTTEPVMPVMFKAIRNVSLHIISI